MKKLPVFLALSCISIAGTAQQKDFFDIQKYLQKKSKESKPASKPLVLLKPSFQNFATPESQPVISGSEFSHSLPNGDKVYILLQDNMPCITSKINRFDISNGFDEKEITSPVNYNKSLPGIIPNVVIPKRIIFSE